MKAQGSSGLRVDLIDVVQKCDVQHHQGENNVRSVKGAVKYERETIGYEQGVFDAKTVQSTNV